MEWKLNGFKTANNKPVKHQELFQASDAIITEHDMIVYWKKSEVFHVNQDKTKTSMTKQVHSMENPGHFMPSHPTLQVAAVTRSGLRIHKMDRVPPSSQ